MPTEISWTDETWNPVSGCSPISPACQNCYAKVMANRLKGRYGYPREETFRITFHEDKLDQPYHWKKPRKIFCGSMTDLFHEDVNPTWILRMIYRIRDNPQHTFIFLTKRSKEMALFFNKYFHQQTIMNLWLGVTVEDQDHLWRIDDLLQIPAVVHFVSIEPMLSHIDILDYLPEDPAGYCEARECAGCGSEEDEPCPEALEWTKHNENKLDWVICGGESGRKARPMHPEWPRSIRNQCQEAGVPFFFKQWGEYLPVDHYNGLKGKYKLVESNGMSFWKTGKKLSGDLLYGEQWKQFPEASK